MKPFVARPIAILIAVVQGLYKLAKAVLDLLRKEKNPEDEPIEAEDLPQPGAENSEPAPEAETDAVPAMMTDHEEHLPQPDGNEPEPARENETDAAREGTNNATPSTADKPV